MKSSFSSSSALSSLVRDCWGVSDSAQAFRRASRGHLEMSGSVCGIRNSFSRNMGKMPVEATAFTCVFSVGICVRICP